MVQAKATRDQSIGGLLSHRSCSSHVSTPAISSTTKTRVTRSSRCKSLPHGFVPVMQNVHSLAAGAPHATIARNLVISGRSRSLHLLQGRLRQYVYLSVTLTAASYFDRRPASELTMVSCLPVSVKPTQRLSFVTGRGDGRLLPTGCRAANHRRRMVQPIRQNSRRSTEGSVFAPEKGDGRGLS